MPRLLLLTGFMLLLSAGHTDAQDCSIPYVPSTFKARLAWMSSKDAASVVATPVVANLNPQQDSMPEIIICTSGANNLFNVVIPDKIEIYRGDGSNRNNPMVLTVPGRFEWYPVPGPTIGDVNNDGIPELLITCMDRRIRVFTGYTENPAAPMTLWITTLGTEQVDWATQRPMLADFDGDGTPEVYTGSDIYRFDFSNPAAPTLRRAIGGPFFQGRAMHSNYVRGVCSPVAVDILSVADCNGDPDCAGLELVAGPVIYSVDLDATDGDGVEMKIQRDLNLMQPGVNYEDGYTSVADLDLDGVLDIVVSGRRNADQYGAFAWNKNNFLQFFPFPVNNHSSGSLPCIANVYKDDGTGPDFPEILVCCNSNFTCFNLNAAQKTPATPYWWNLPTSDQSGWTGSTVYDFNGDGILEIVYRDESFLRILYGGPAPFPTGVDAQRNWFRTPCVSGTSDEYAVVADVDNDGETEITVTGKISNSGISQRGRLWVYESDSGPWVPSRNLWNQYNYFAINVNDDLSIPAQQRTDHHLELPAPGSGNRPFNRYLSQRPVLNENYETSIPLPDAAAEVNKVICNPNDFTLLLNICNYGDKVLKAGTPIAFYASDPTTTAAPLLSPAQFLPLPLLPDSCTTISLTLPNTTTAIFGVVNDNGSKPRPYQLATDFPVNGELECNWLNNIFQFLSPTAQLPPNLGPDLSTCHDTLVTLNAGPAYAAYRWQDGSTAPTFVAQQPGLYWVEVTDFCQQKHADTVRLEVFGAITAQLDTLNGDCYGTIGTATAQAASPYPPLTYRWSTGDTSPSLSGIPDGTYTVTITNAKGCTTARSTWVEAGGLLQVSATAPPIRCFGEKSDISLSFAAGRPPYTYLWSSGSTGPDFPAAPAGDHSVTVTDADGCAQILPIPLSQPAALSSAGIQHQPACPSEANGSAAFLGAAQGTAPYTLRWSNNNETVPTLTGLPAGPYALTITDANGCELVETVQVSAFLSPTASAAVADVSCFGKNDGSVAVSLAGGSPGFGYAWSGGSAAPKIEDLAPGTYTLTLTYADSKCAQVFDYQIQEPLPILLSTVSSPAICNGGLGGSIDLTVQNGIAPLAFFWSNGTASEDPTNLQTGAYQVTVTDATGCTKTYAQSVAELPSIALSATPQQPKCAGGSDGSIQILPSGGTPPFQFLWSNGGTGGTATSLAAGVYSITVTDAGACTEVLAVSVGEPTPLISAGIAPQPACPGEANGSAAFLGAAQGTAPYTLRWSNSETTPNLTGLAAGNYALTITDANGCELVETAQVSEFLPPTAAATVSDVSCFGKNDGHVAVSLAGGSPGFGYAWSGGSAAPKIEDLAPGTYTLTLTYADSKCAQVFDYQIQEPMPILLSTVSSPAICNGGLGGSIDLTVQNGIAPLAFFWSNGTASEDPTNLQTGAYQVTVTDATGCTKTYAQSVAELPSIALSATPQQPKCAGGSDGSIQILPSGGTPPFQFLWSNGGTGGTATSLAAGVYSVTVTDAGACTEVLAVSVGEPTALTSAGIAPQPACPGEANGSAAFLGAAQGTAPYTLRWSNNATGPNLTGLSAGNYALTITDANGCELVETAQVSEFLPPTAAAAVSDVSCFGKNDGRVAVSLAGGSPGFGYVWSSGSAASKIEGLAPGTYSLTLTYADGKCTQMFDYQIKEPTELALLDPAATAVKCFGGVTGAVNLTAAGGIAPYQFVWSGGQKTEDIAQVAAGNYVLTLTDANGCTFTEQFTVPQPDVLRWARSVHADTCHSSSGAIVTQAAGGVQPYQFTWSNAASSPNLAGLSAGAYALTLTDANGCTHALPVQVPNFGDDPVLTAFAGFITCAQPSVVVGVSADQSNLNYAWSAPSGPLGNEATHTVLVGGLYRVTATNVFGCQSDTQIQVLEDKAAPVAQAGLPSLKVPCTETKIVLSAAGSSQGSPFQNRWSGQPVGSAGFDTLAVTVPIFEPGLYVHTVLNTANGCSARDSVWVDWDEPIRASLSVEDVRCFGYDDGEIRILNATGGKPPLRYSIDNLHFTAQNTFTGLPPGTYPVRVEDGFGCWWETSAVLTEPDSLAVRLTVSDTSIELGRYINLTALPLPKGTQWSDIVWGPSGLIFSPKSLSQKVKPEKHTEFAVRIFDQNGCWAEDRVLVRVHDYGLYVPNVILPGSGLNGQFTVFAGEGVSEIRLLRVFDRWGELVFERRGFAPNDPVAGWDGSLRGQPLSPGVCVWYAEVLLQDGQVLGLKGDVTVVR